MVHTFMFWIYEILPMFEPINGSLQTLQLFSQIYQNAKLVIYLVVKVGNTDGLRWDFEKASSKAALVLIIKLL